MTSMLTSSIRRKVGMMMTTSTPSISILPKALCSSHVGARNTLKMNFRQFSSDVKQSSSKEQSKDSQQIRLIPTRHSRHHVPPIAPGDVLDNATVKIVKSIHGTLFGKLYIYMIIMVMMATRL